MKSILLILLTVLLAGCSTVDIREYRDSQPSFSLFDYFAGETRGWGIVQDRSGRVTRQFVVEIRGEIEGSTLTLYEKFNWLDGERSTRTWIIDSTGEHTFTGTADDVEGYARGSMYGNSLNWKYHLNIRTADSTWKIHLDDWMYLLPDNVLLNKTEMSKFGIHLGDITITFRKTDKA